MKALVTGAAGFIGSHVAEALVKDGAEVVAVDDLSGGFEDNVPKGALWKRGSVTDYVFLEKLFTKYRFDHVFHLAAYAAEGLSHFIRHYNYSNNLLGSVNLINLGVKYKIKCFVFTSSIAVYGKNQLPMAEDLVPCPEDPYGISKYAVELDLKAAHELFGLNSIIFRPHNVYGERQNIGDKYRNVIGIFMNQMLQKKPVTVFGDGEQTRAFSYISDVAGVIAQSVKTPKAYGQVFNVGGDVATSVKKLAGIVAKEMGVTLELHHLKARNEVVHAFASHEKIKKYFELAAPVSLEEGIHKMAIWAKKMGPRKSKPFAAIEIKENLPEGW